MTQPSNLEPFRIRALPQSLWRLRILSEANGRACKVLLARGRDKDKIYNRAREAAHYAGVILNKMGR